MGKLTLQSAPGFNAGLNFLSKMVRCSEITTDPEICNVFNIEERVLELLIESIKKHGFYKDQPVVLWRVEGKLVLVDGRTRLTAAKEAGLEEVPAVEKEFESRDEALMYTFERQALRRNLTSAEIYRAVEMLPEGRNEHGLGSKARELAKRLGVSESTIYHGIEVKRNSSKEDQKAVREGNMSLKKAVIKNRLIRNEGKEKTVMPSSKKKAVTDDAKEKIAALSSNVLTAHAKIGSALDYINDDKASALLNEAMDCLKTIEGTFQNFESRLARLV